MKIIIRSGLLAVGLLVFLSLSAAAQTGKCGDKDYDCKIAENAQRIAANANDIEAYYNLASAYREAGKYVLAISTINKYIAMNPGKKEYLADAYFLRGNANRDNKDPDAALTDFSTAISLNPVLTNAYINRGLIYKNKKNYVSAIADLTKAVQIDPNEPESYYNRGLTYETKGDFSKAIVDYDKYISMNTPESEYIADGYSRRGVTYSMMGNYTQAIKDISAAIRIFPTKARFYTNRASVYRKQGNIELAKADEEKAASLGN